MKIKQHTSSNEIEKSYNAIVEQKADLNKKLDFCEKYGFVNEKEEQVPKGRKTDIL